MNYLDPESAAFLHCQGGQCYQAGACLLTNSIHPQLLSAREQLIGIMAAKPFDPAQLSKLYQQMYSLYAWASEHVSSCARSYPS